MGETKRTDRALSNLTTLVFSDDANVLVNALGSVLERLRHGEPELIPICLTAAQVLLDEV